MHMTQEQALLAALNEHRKVHRRIPDYYGIPLGEFHLLHLIQKLSHTTDGKETGVQASQLSTQLQISRSAVSQLLNSLAKKDLVRRTVSQQDRRMVHVCLTEHGRTMTADMQQFIHRLMDAVLKELGAENTDTLIHLLRRMNQIMQSLDLEAICRESKPTANS